MSLLPPCSAPFQGVAESNDVLAHRGAVRAKVLLLLLLLLLLDSNCSSSSSSPSPSSSFRSLSFRTPLSFSFFLFSRRFPFGFSFLPFSAGALCFPFSGLRQLLLVPIVCVGLPPSLFRVSATLYLITPLFPSFFLSLSLYLIG